MSDLDHTIRGGRGKDLYQTWTIQYHKRDEEDENRPKYIYIYIYIYNNIYIYYILIIIHISWIKIDLEEIIMI